MANQSSPAVRQLVGCGQLGVTVLVSDMPHTERDAENIQAWRTAASVGGLRFWVTMSAPVRHLPPGHTALADPFGHEPRWSAAYPVSG